MRKYIRYILLPVIIGFLIFTATCLVSSDSIPKMPNIIPWDKFVHFGMFFVLSFVNFIDYYKLYEGKPNKFKWIFWSFILPVIYGGAIDIMQEYFFSRSGEWADFIADMLGSATAMVIVMFLWKKYWEKGKKAIFVK